MNRRSGVWMAVLMTVLAMTRYAGSAEDGYIDFRFDRVDVRAFVKVMGELTGKRFVVDERVRGQITVEAPRIAAADAYPLAVAILEAAGYTAVEGGDVVKIVPLDSGSIPIGAVQGPDSPSGGVGFLTRVIRLRQAPANEVKLMLADVLGSGKQAQVSALPSANLIVASGTADLVRRIEAMVEAIDKPGLARVMEVLPMRHVAAEELAKQLNDALAAAETEADRIRQQIASGGRPAGLKAVASPQANSLILVGPQAAVDDIKGLIAKLDVEVPSGRGRLRAIFLKYLTAEDAAKSLKALLAVPAGKSGAPPAAIAIEPIAANNALLVDAAPRDFEVVEQLVRELDCAPGQVMIEVLIAEVSLSEGLDIGVEWAALDMPGKVGDMAVQANSTLNENSENLMQAAQNSLFPRGLSVGIAHGTRVAADGTLQTAFPALFNLNAVKKNGQVKILSNVPLLAQNNQEASVSVVNNIPILKSTIQGGSGTSRDVIQNIERMDVGIKLKLTPQINPDGEVKMKLNPSIEAILDPGVDGAYTPTIAKREVSTTVTVPDGQIIVLSGLIREDRTKVVRKIPLLGSLPLIGWLFRRTTDQMERTNLLIFVRPRLVKPGDEAALTADWEERSGISQTNRPGRLDAVETKP